ncbi:MAG: hypothetical protein ACRDNF_25990 [Streptosporangiaceae bacterium]
MTDEQTKEPSYAARMAAAVSRDPHTALRVHRRAREVDFKGPSARLVRGAILITCTERISSGSGRRGT